MSFWLPVAFIIAGLVFRVAPHPANFSPIFAIALFGGTYFADKRLGLIVPLLALSISDFFLGSYDPLLMIFVYGGLLLTGMLGLWLRNHKSVVNVLGSAVASAGLFYFLSNFGVWLNPLSGYSRDLAGLGLCYFMALPFLKYSLAGNLFYVAILFGGYELVRLALRRRVARHLA
jgi:hypothetical protein